MMFFLRLLFHPADARLFFRLLLADPEEVQRLEQTLAETLAKSAETLAELEQLRASLPFQRPRAYLGEGQEVGG